MGLARVDGHGGLPAAGADIAFSEVDDGEPSDRNAVQLPFVGGQDVRGHSMGGFCDDGITSPAAHRVEALPGPLRHDRRCRFSGPVEEGHRDVVFGVAEKMVAGRVLVGGEDLEGPGEGLERAGRRGGLDPGSGPLLDDLRTGENGIPVATRHRRARPLP